MEGLYIRRKDLSRVELQDGQTSLELLARHGETEIMLQSIKPGSVIWLTPGEDPTLLEFFYVLEGELTLELPEGRSVLGRGELFYAQGMKEELRMENEGFVRLLYISSKPVFDYLYSHLGDLKELLHQANEKDKYTYGHGERVMEYSLMIGERLGMTENLRERLTLVSLFHDVGKIFVPNEVLNKPGKLTEDEFRYIKRHPVDSHHLLSGKFGDEVADIAAAHHERLDGSGYPYGLRGDEIPMEARIIAVADSFDAMTSVRPYKGPRNAQEAAGELLGLTNLYDAEAVRALWELVQEGKIVVAPVNTENKE